MNAMVTTLADCFKSFMGHYYHQGWPNFSKNIGATTQFLMPEG
jgi:hypothetical protein